MAVLIVEHDGKVAGGLITGRVVIGRRPGEQVYAPDESVSPIHAWIGLARDGTHYVADAGSATGTFVNDRRISVRKRLRSGDRIRIGPLLLRITDDAALPAGTAPMDFSRRVVPQSSPKEGISFDCACGAPIWAPWNAAGKVGTCRVCKGPLTVPRPKTAAAPVKSAAPPRHCGVCHGAIRAAEQTTRCPDCATLFHVECWTENRGCSVYGCPQVGILQPVEAQEAGAESREVAATGQQVDFAATEEQRVPLAYLLLAVSVLAAVVGAFTFGATSLLSAAAALLYLVWRNPRQHRRIVLLATVVSLVGTAGGAVASYYWWRGAR